MNETPKNRCGWVRPGDNLYEQYHDTEWGVRTYDDRRLFEFLLLESAQAGLSWETILKKRAAYREAFAQFDPKKIARFSRRDIDRLMKNSGIVRHRLKIEAAISNARLFLEVQKEFGSFAKYLNQFVHEYPKSKQKRSLDDIPVLTEQSEALTADLKARGFKFFGPVIAYAYMQAVGMVNDHTTDCFRYQEIKKFGKKKTGVRMTSSAGKLIHSTAAEISVTSSDTSGAVVPTSAELVRRSSRHCGTSSSVLLQTHLS